MLEELQLLLLYLAPTVLLALLLVFGRYPGEKVLARALRRAARPRLRPARSMPPPRRRRASTPRGGVLVAHGLAGRAPPW